MEMNFEVTNVRFPILSVHRLVVGGCNVCFEKGGSYVECPGYGREYLVVKDETF